MLVIDVSDYQEGLNYDTAIGRGIKGVIIKISEGNRYSQLWWSHLSECETRDIPWGVYCLTHATTPDEARQEANEVLYLLQGRVPPLGVWFDVEADKAPLMDDPTAVCSAFIVECNKKGLKCGIYASLSTFEDYIRVNTLADYVPYWVAQYNVKCDFLDEFPGHHLSGWQNTSERYHPVYIDGMCVDTNDWYDEVD